MPELTTAQLVLVIVLGTVQLGLMLIGLITLFRTPAERLTAPRIVWVLVCLVQFVGPIVFLVVGRKPESAVEPQRPAQAGPVLDRLIAELYPRAER